MSADEQKCSDEIENMRKLLYGDPTTGKGGLAHVVETIGTTLYGSERIPGGLVNDVAQIKKMLYMAIGAVTIVQFGIQILFHFWPAK